MSEQVRSWSAVRDDVLDRIRAGLWKPGQTIPNEVDLAAEYGCARTTVNRALRDLAEDGVLERRRKAGTRVARYPIRRASFQVPLIREQVEAMGESYGHRLLDRTVGLVPDDVPFAADVPGGLEALFLRTVHSGDGTPFVHERRWVNREAAPDIEMADLAAVSAHEWLLRHVPLTGGRMVFAADSASREEAALFDVPAGTPLLVMDRVTFSGDRFVTLVRLAYRPGTRLGTPD